MAKKKRNIKNWLKESMFILIPAALVFGTFTVVIKPAVVSGNSMNDTYQNGDHLLLWRHAEPKKGDAIVCNSKLEKALVKRVIAEGGDTVDIDFDTGTVKVNGEVLVEPYIKELTTTDEGGWDYPITVPDDCYFVMGDNRNNSRDSRSADVGCIPKKDIQGVAFLKWAM